MERVEIGPAVLYCGDSFELMRSGSLGEFDAVITDPPYASGGMFRQDRTASVTDKYEQSGQKLRRAIFAHDCKDQRSWTSWCAEWLSLLPVKEGGYVQSFIDWRQLPAITDAMQWAGLMWRGICSWDKGPSARAPHKGYARHQAEFLAWATKGPCQVATHGGPWPGVYRHPVLQSDKHHISGKPTPLLEELVQWVPPGGSVFDPFMGSGTAGVAALRQGRKFVGVEIDPDYFNIACKRIRHALEQIQSDLLTRDHSEDSLDMVELAS